MCIPHAGVSPLLLHRPPPVPHSGEDPTAIFNTDYTNGPSRHHLLRVTEQSFRYLILLHLLLGSSTDGIQGLVFLIIQPSVKQVCVAQRTPTVIQSPRERRVLRKQLQLRDIIHVMDSYYRRQGAHVFVAVDLSVNITRKVINRFR